MELNKNDEVNQYMDAITEPNIQVITTRLRQLIFETDEQFIEEIKWGMPSYSKHKKNICYLQPSKKHVNLGFYAGANLPDQYKLLEGTGKVMRHVRIKKAEDIQFEKFKALIQEAIEFDE